MIEFEKTMSIHQAKRWLSSEEPAQSPSKGSLAPKLFHIAHRHTKAHSYACSPYSKASTAFLWQGHRQGCAFYSSWGLARGEHHHSLRVVPADRFFRHEHSMNGSDHVCWDLAECCRCAGGSCTGEGTRPLGEISWPPPPHQV
jgi:hypothetical protein